MKNRFTLLLFLSIQFFAFSQDCSTFYPFSESSSWQITTYEKPDKVSAIVDYKVTDLSSSSGNETATMSAIVKDKKGKLIAETNYDVICNGDRISIDFKSMMNPQMFKQFSNMETEITGTNLELPNNLAVGQELPDASMDMKISMSGINMNMSTSIKDRKVIGKESVTTPAGTFSCYVISYSSEFNSMGMNQNSSAKQWISEGVGMVKQEDYNSNGKVTSSSLLTAFSK